MHSTAHRPDLVPDVDISEVNKIVPAGVAGAAAATAAVAVAGAAAP